MTEAETYNDYNPIKCKIMHFGYNGNKFNYTMMSHDEEVAFEKVEEEKDLSIFFYPTLIFSKHAAKCAAKRNSLLGRIKRAFTEIDKDILIPIYKTLVRYSTELQNWYQLEGILIIQGTRIKLLWTSARGAVCHLISGQALRNHTDNFKINF